MVMKSLVPGSYTRFDADAKDRFLAHFAEFGLFYQSAAAAGFSGECVRRHLKEDEEFAAAFEEARGAFRDKVEAEIRRRAVEGWQEYLTCGKGLITDAEGRPVLQRRYSDRMLELYAKRHIPEFREKQTVDVNHTGGVLLVPAQMTPEQWKAENAKVVATQEQNPVAVPVQPRRDT